MKQRVQEVRVAMAELSNLLHWQCSKTAVASARGKQHVFVVQGYPEGGSRSMYVERKQYNPRATNQFAW